MKLDNVTLSVLKNFCNINQSIYIKKGRLISTISPTGAIFAEAKLNQDFPVNFAIYDLSTFLSVVSMFKESTLDFNVSEDYVKVLDETGKRGVNYYYADEDSILSPPGETLPDFDSIVEFNITSNTLTKTISALGILNLETFAIIGDGKSLTLQAIDNDKTNSNYYDEIGDTDLSFKALFNKDNIKLINDDYNIKLNEHFGIFSSDYMKYFIALDENSKF